jgi:hypothetical protein
MALGPSMSDWIDRVYRVGKSHRVVVEGLLEFEVDRLDKSEVSAGVRTVSKPRFHQVRCCQWTGLETTFGLLGAEGPPRIPSVSANDSDLDPVR